MASSGTSTASCTNGDAQAHGTAPIRLRPERVGRHARHPDLHGLAGHQARSIAGISSGSTLTTLARPWYHDATPAISPPPPTATSTVSSPGAWSSSSRHRALAGHDQLVVVGVHEERAGLRGPPIGGALRVVVDLAPDHERAHRSR